MASLQLIQKNVKKKNINLCITCQKNKATEKLSSTDNGRKKLLTASKILKDELFDKFNDNNILSLTYHCSCYKTYILRAERQNKNKLAEISSAENNSLEHETKDGTEPKVKRRKSQDNAPKICIICQQQYMHRDNKLFRLCETDRANLFISATRFNLDDVYTRTSFYDTKEQLFAADILSHKQCMNKYLLQYERDMDRTISYYLEDVDDELNVQLKLMVEMDPQFLIVATC